MAETLVQLYMDPTRTARVVASAFPTVERAIADGKATMAKMRAVVSGRTTGRVVYPDGKAPCPAGPFADDVSYGKSNELDPNHCLVAGGPWIQPLLERPFGCEMAGTDLVWLEEAKEAQAALRKLANAFPTHAEDWRLQLAWFELVMELCTFIGMALNLRPFSFMLSGAWGEKTGKPHFGFAPWGEPLTAFFNEVRAAVGSTNFPVALPMVKPTYIASAAGLGWNQAATTANSLYSHLLKGENLLDFDGYFGCNTTQSKIKSGVGGVGIKNPWGYGAINGISDEMAYAIPDAALRYAGGQDAAYRAVKAWIAKTPAERRSLLFQYTGSAEAVLLRGYYVGRNWALASGLPKPAEQHENHQYCWAPTARMYMRVAKIWADAMVSFDPADRLLDSTAGYLQILQKGLETIQKAGLPLTVKPSDIQSLREAALARKREALAAMMGTQTAILAVVNGLVAAIVTAVYTIVLGGFSELLRSVQSPKYQGGPLWGLAAVMLQPFVMRTPKLESACSFSAEEEGGAARLVTAFGTGGPLFPLSQGMDAPAAFRGGVDAPPPSAGVSPLAIAAGVGVAAVGGALLWRFLSK